MKRGVVVSIMTLAAVPAVAAAQERFRAVLGAGIAGVRPVGEFHRFVREGVGLTVHGALNPSLHVPVGIRLDIGALLYGHERFDVAPSPTLPRIELEGTTTNAILSLGVGPQLTLGGGDWRPYGFVTGGLAYFATSSEVHARGDGDGSFSTLHFDDVSAALTAGAGVTIRLSGRRNPALLDLSVVTVRSGPTEYLREGSLVDQPDGSVSFVPIVSRTNMVQFRAGVSVGLR